MSEKVCFPIRFGRGRCRVTIYNRTTALPYYRICYRLGAIRHQRTFNTVSEAMSHAESVSEKLRSKDASVTQITGNDLAQFQVAKELLCPLGHRVDTAVHHYVKALKTLKEVPLDTAVRFYLNHNRPLSHNLTLQQLVDRFLTAKRQEGISEAYFHDLRKRTRSLVEYTDTDQAGITPKLIKGYFNSLNFNAVNHNNQARAIRAFIKFKVIWAFEFDEFDEFEEFESLPNLRILRT